MDKMDDMLLRATLLMNGFGGSCKPTATELEKMRAEAKSLEMLSKQEEIPRSTYYTICVNLKMNCKLVHCDFKGILKRV